MQAAEIHAACLGSALYRDIRAGTRACQTGCEYYSICGGGSPVNKLFENGTFASTETLFCRLHKQACLDVSMDKLECSKAPA